MASATTQLSIANRALQLLGYQSISSLQENSRGARAVNRAYQSVLLGALRSNYWNFSIKRASLPASASPPLFGKANYFPLPPDFLDLAPPDPVFGITGGGVISGPPAITDWQIEGNQIASNDKSPINIRYVSQNITESAFDPLFAEALSALVATEICEELTQSNTKLAAVGKVYDDIMDMAKKRNAFEGRPVQPPTDSWILSRF